MAGPQILEDLVQSIQIEDGLDCRALAGGALEEPWALALAQRLNAVLTSQAFTLGTISPSCHGRLPAMADDEPTNDHRSDVDPNEDSTEHDEPAQLSRSKSSQPSGECLCLA